MNMNKRNKENRNKDTYKGWWQYENWREGN